MPSLLRTGTDGAVQILSAFESGPATIPANDGYEAWEVVGGAFRVELTAVARLKIISFVAAGCQGYVRCYDITNSAVTERILSQTIVTNEQPVAVKLGANFNVVGGHVYQIQARCSGSISIDNQFFIANVTPKDGT